MESNDRSNDRILKTSEVREIFNFKTDNAVRAWASRNNIPRYWGKYYESDVRKARMK